MAQSKRRAFDYTPPSYEDAKQMSEKRGSFFDNIFIEGTKFFKAKDGDNEIRIFPPTWEDCKHYSYEISVHRDIGPDKQQYLCLDKNELSPEPGRCPICAERRDLLKTKASQKEIDELRPSTTNVIYLIDRNKRDDGPVVWQISNRTDAEIISQSLIKRTQVYLPIAHPIDGYDVEFVREGAGRLTKYRGFKIARDSSPITDDPDKLDEWLSHVEEHPIPDILHFYSSEHIRRVFRGEAATEKTEDTEEPIRHQTRVKEEEPEEVPFETTRPNGSSAREETVESERPEPSRRSRIDDEPKPSTETSSGPSVDTLRDRLRQRIANRE